MRLASRRLRRPSRPASLRTAALSAYAIFAETSTREEAECYGGFPHSRDQAHVHFADMASAVSALELPAFLAAPGRYRSRTSWRPGTAARGAPPGLTGAATRLLMWRRIALERARTFKPGRK